MRRRHDVLPILVLLALVVTGRAEAYRLRNGTSVEGDITRVEGNSVVIRTATGYSTYHINEFEYETKKSIMARYAIRRTLDTASSAKEAIGITFSDPEYLCVISGLCLLLVAYVWLVVAGFAESPVWGLAIVLSNFLGGLAFTVLHFRRAKWPILLTAAGIGLLVYGLVQLSQAGA
jgi:hypothetical protein